MGAAGEGSKGHSAATLLALSKACLRLREDLTAPRLPLQTGSTVAAWSGTRIREASKFSSSKFNLAIEAHH